MTRYLAAAVSNCLLGVLCVLTFGLLAAAQAPQRLDMSPAPAAVIASAGASGRS